MKKINVLLIALCSLLFAQNLQAQVNPATLNYLYSLDTNMYMLIFDPDLSLGSQTNRISLGTLDARYSTGGGLDNYQTSPGSNSVYSYSTVAGAERVNVLFIPSTADTDGLPQSETILYFAQDEDDVIGPEIRSSSSGFLQGNGIVSLNQSTRSYMQFFVSQGFSNLTDTQEIMRLIHNLDGNQVDLQQSALLKVGEFAGVGTSITFSDPLTKWVTATIDGSDDQAILISGGGSNGTSRGAYMSVSGNEHVTSAGDVGIGTGEVGEITMISATDIIMQAGTGSTLQTNGTHTSNISDANDVVTKGYADANYGVGTWTTYSPTSVSSSNVDSYSIDFAEYQSNATLVKGTIKGQINPTASGNAEITISAPATAGADVFCGVGRGINTSLGQAIVQTSSSGTRLYIQFPSNTATTNQQFYFTFSYAK